MRIVKRSLNPRIELEGVLLTMFDGRTNLANQVAEEVKRYFPGKVYATVIPRTVRLSEAPASESPSPLTIIAAAAARLTLRWLMNFCK